MDSIFRMEGVSKSFGRHAALTKVSFEALPGTVIGLLGENGAGKTTAIRILLGLAAPDEGTAEVFGLESRTEGQEIRRRVGYVPEQPTLYDWMSVAEIGWFTAGFHGGRFLPRYHERAARFELPPDRRLKNLSKGMRAKVALALAMAHEPHLLVLDEPTSGLDPVVRREFLENMVEVAASGRTVLLSSHQVGEVERVADVVAILRKGRLVVFEKLDDLKSSVRELTVTLADGAAECPVASDRVISRQWRDRQWRVLVRDMNDADLQSLRAADSICAVDVRHPSLEEIFLAYMSPAGEPVGESS